MRDERGGLEEDVNVVGRGALYCVGVPGDPSGISWGGPVELGGYGAAELGDGALDFLVEFGEALVWGEAGGGGFVIVVVFGAGFIAGVAGGWWEVGGGVGWFPVVVFVFLLVGIGGGVVGEDYAVFVDVGDEVGGEGDDFGTDTGCAIFWEPVIVRTVKDVFPGDRREDDFVILVCDRLRRLSFDGGHDVTCLVDQLWVDRRKWPENV